MRTSFGMGLVTSLFAHATIVTAMTRLDPQDLAPKKPDIVDLEVREVAPPPLPPPPPEPPPPEPPPPPPPPKRVHVPPPKVVEAPPPPNTEPPPEPPPPDEPPPPPSFGVTLDSVVQGDSPVAVPVGNTVMTKERNTAPSEAPRPLPAALPGPPAFNPISELYIGELPSLQHEVKADYPREAMQMGMRGSVVMRVGISRKGSIHSVKVVRKAGYGFDEAAVKAMWQFRFSPCKTKQGDAVDCLITYKYTFEPSR
jgi:periplasmic protein TonB